MPGKPLMRGMNGKMRATVLAIALALPAAQVSAQDDAFPRATPIGNPGAWIPPNGYPPAAKASAEEGRVSFTLKIDPSGTVNDCKVTTSSESPLLDETTCNFMIANGRFTPARDKKNKPVASQWSSSVRWKLEEPPPVATPTMSPPLTGKAKLAAPNGNPGEWFTDKDYPAAAKKQQQQGRVEFSMAIDAGGRATGCAIIKTSGSPLLDKVTCDLAMKRGTFTPARDADGRAIPGSAKMATTWIIP